MVISFGGKVVGLGAVLDEFDLAEKRVAEAVRKGMRRGVLGGQSIVRGNARGRPGPRAPHGDFNRSIVGETEVDGDTVWGQIGTNAAQGPRLEFGFTGTDVLGRVYDQPPYPYLKPSETEVENIVRNQIEEQIRETL